MAKKDKRKLGTGSVSIIEKKTRDTILGKTRNPERAPEEHVRWWTRPIEALGTALATVVSYIHQNQTSLLLQRQVCARLYGGASPGSFYGTTTTDRLHVVHPSITGRLTYNIIAIVIDSLLSKLTKNTVRPLFLTQGGDYKLQRRAKKLSQFADGIFYETKFDETDALIIRDGLVGGDGVTHVFENPATGRIEIERVLMDELYVDEVDGFYGKPTQIHRVKLMDRQVAVESFCRDESDKLTAAKVEIVNRATNGTRVQGGPPSQYIADMVAVVESWKLPSGPKAGDGRHCITVDSGCLFDEEYKKTRFPFSRFSWKSRLVGWHGAGLAEELIGTQVEMNHLLYMMQRAFRLVGGFKIFVENGTVPDAHFTDRMGTILHIPKGAQKPEYLTPPVLNAQYFQHFEQVKARGFEIARITQLSATGAKPAGLDSGEAQRVYHDIEGEGLVYANQRHERYVLDTIMLVLDVVRDIQTREGSYKLQAPVSSSAMPGKRFLRSINWKQVQMEEDEFVLKCYPTSNLPNTPAGRLATVTDLTQAGFIDGETSRKLMDFPDLAQVETLLGAAEDWICSVLDRLIEDDEYDPPDPLMNLAMAEKLVLQEIALGAVSQMEEEKLDSLKNWLSQVHYLKAQAALANAPQAPTAAPQPGMPPPGPQPGLGAPMPPPQSPLLPVNGASPAIPG